MLARTGAPRSLAIVPHKGPDYEYCIVQPGALAAAWPTSPLVDQVAAVPLEVEPEWWVADAPPVLNTYEQTWPSDVARAASRVGCEVSFSIAGVPQVGRGLLVENTKWFWHHLTLGLLQPGSWPGDLELWRQHRQRLLANLSPDAWSAPQECNAVIHVAEADYILILTPHRALVESWIAGQLAIVLDVKQPDGPSANAVLSALARWIMTEAGDRGVRLTEVAVEAGGDGVAVIARGMWGRGRDTLIPIGDVEGPAFERRFYTRR